MQALPSALPPPAAGSVPADCPLNHMGGRHEEERVDKMVIRPIRADEHAAVKQLLASARLPIEGLDSWWGSTLVAATRGGVVGSAALELHGGDAVLRSVCVAESHRGERLGQRLVEASLELARQHQVRDVYLLTETAADFFQRLGFEIVSRDAAPCAVQESVEFASVCPASATALARRVGAACSEPD